MRHRLHFELLSQDGTHLFKAAGIDKTPHQAAQRVNPYTAPHDGICGTIGHETDDTAFEVTFDERYEHNSKGNFKFTFRIPHMVVMRGHVQCSCCGPVCFNCGQGAAKKPTPKSGHGPGAEYNEAVLDLITLQPLAREAMAKVGDKAYGAGLKALADSVGLTADDIQSHLFCGDLALILSSVADVFAATTVKPSDIFYTAAFLQLLTHPDKGWLKSAHNKLSRDWPQRPSPKPTSVEVTQ